MGALLRLLSMRHVRTHWVRTLLATASIMLGVALFVSTEVAHTSTLRSFEAAQDRLAGRARYHVTGRGGAGTDVTTLNRLESIAGVHAAPVLQQSVALPDHPDEGRLVLLGVDFAREQRLRAWQGVAWASRDPLKLLLDPTAVVVTAAFSKRTGLGLGDALRLRTPTGITRVTVRGVVRDAGPARVFRGAIAFMGLAGAQRAVGRTTFDRIDVAPGTVSRTAIEAAAGDAHQVTDARGGNKTLNDMLGHVRSLVILSVIGLLVGLFIVYLSVSIGVIERGRAIGTARALGASRHQVLGVFLIEALVLGLVGSVAGVALGWLLARLYLGFIVDTVNRLVSLVDVDHVVLPTYAAVGGVVAGVGASVLAAYFPARRASRIAPTRALRPATISSSLVPDYRHALVAGAGVLLVGMALTTVQVASPPWVGLVATALMFLGLALMLPQCTIWLSRWLRTPLRRLFRAEGFLAADNVMRYPQRSALTVVALGGALALMVTSASIISSFRYATSHWLQRAMPFDLSIQPAQLSGTVYSSAVLPGNLPARVQTLPGVRDVYALRVRVLPWNDESVALLAVDMAAFQRALQFRGLDLEGGTAADHECLIAGQSVGISQNFSVLHGVKENDPLTLATPTGPITLPVSHVIEDYSWPRGVVVLDLAAYRQHFDDESLTYVDLTVDGDPDTVRAQIDARLADLGQTFVYSADDMWAYAMDALEDSFVLANAQVAVAMIIGFLGILNTLLISVLRRKREIGLLRVVGMNRAGIARMVSIEALIVAIVGGVFGIAAGLVAAAVPASNHVLLMTGYALPLVVPWTTLGLVLLTATAIGWIASVAPARRAADVDVLHAIGYE